MKTLILGNGGRENALAYTLARSKVISELHCAQRNPGIAQYAELHAQSPVDSDSILKLCREHGIQLVVVGPEAPLVAGVADILRSKGIKVFGPGCLGARLESSKIFSKKFMQKNGILTSAFDCCHTLEECRRALEKRSAPYVVKADGLAAGKGAFLPDTFDEAIQICRSLIEENALGESGKNIVIEDYVPGKELTILAVTDGETIRMLSPSQDHKRIFDGDKGGNTGGMGAYSAVPWVSEELLSRIDQEVLQPTLAGLIKEGIEYCGVIYAGLMLTEDNRIFVIEYNARLGDPEAQVVLPIFEGDLGEVLLACCHKELHRITWSAPSRYALGVVLSSQGYPGHFEIGCPIEGLDCTIPDTIVFHSGTGYEKDGTVVTAGGRVLTVVGVANTFEEARLKAYQRVETISFKGCHYRKDIGKGGLL